MILSSGIIRAIARSHPTITVDVLASPANAIVLVGEPSVRRVLVVDRGRPWAFPALVWRRRRARYDAVVDCMPTSASLTTLMLMLASGARHRVGVSGRGIDDALTIPVPARIDARHIIDRLAAVAVAFGCDAETTDCAPALALSDDERARADALWRLRARGRRMPARRRLLVNISAGTVARSLPDDIAVEILRRAHARWPDVQTLVHGAPAERQRAAAIARAAGTEAVRAAGLRDALALVATSDVVLTPDAAISHAATALHIPAVVVLPRGKARLWGLYRSPGLHVETDGVTPAKVDAGMVIAALAALLSETTGWQTGGCGRAR